MAYQHIDNLYKNQDILLFKECYAMEKIHGTSAHVAWDGTVSFFSGGSKHATFVAIFNQDELAEAFQRVTPNCDRKIVIYGEAYGGSVQKMKDVYGDKLGFVAFEVSVDGMFLDVPRAESMAADVGLEFVHYKQIPATLEAIDAERDADSVQAVRNGMGTGHAREGVVLRPLVEVTKNNEERIVAKHKRDDFAETATPRKVLDEGKLAVLDNARKVADEWVTEMRLDHILDNKEPDMCNMRTYIIAMCEDVVREAYGEVEDALLGSSELRKEIGRACAIMVKRRVAHALTKGV